MFTEISMLVQMVNPVLILDQGRERQVRLGQHKQHREAGAFMCHMRTFVVPRRGLITPEHTCVGGLPQVKEKPSGERPSCLVFVLHTMLTLLIQQINSNLWLK